MPSEKPRDQPSDIVMIYALRPVLSAEVSFPSFFLAVVPRETGKTSTDFTDLERNRIIGVLIGVQVESQPHRTIRNWFKLTMRKISTSCVTFLIVLCMTQLIYQWPLQLFPFLYETDPWEGFIDINQSINRLRSADVSRRKWALFPNLLPPSQQQRRRFGARSNRSSRSDVKNLILAGSCSF